MSAFVEGLLPEGNLRWHIASQAGVQATDTVGLLERVGAEYAGAVQILPKGVVPGAGHVRRLSNREITTLVADLPTCHLPERRDTSGVLGRRTGQGAAGGAARRGRTRRGGAVRGGRAESRGGSSSAR